MPAYAFICKKDGSSWSATGYGDNAELTASADSEYELSKELRKMVGEKEPGMPIKVEQGTVVAGKKSVWTFIAGGTVAVAAGGAAGGAAAPAAEEKKEESEEEESDDDMGFSLFD